MLPRKCDWDEDLKKKIIIGGDFNIIPNEEDVYNPEDWENDALYRTEIRKFFRNILNEGYEDAFRLVNKQPNNYTFWDYQYGSFENFLTLWKSKFNVDLLIIIRH